MYNYDNIINKLKKLNCDIFKDEPMANYTSFKIGGPADLFVIVKDKSSLSQILKESNENNMPFYMIGNGSNLLISDKGIRGIAVKLGGEFLNVNLIEENLIRCGAGVSISKLCRFAFDNSFSGLEFAWGIPGSAGGAAFMNAGAYGGEMKNVLLYCNHVNRQGKEGRLYSKDLDLGYRKSAYTKNGFIITDIVLELKKDNKTKIESYMSDYMKRRKDKQPLEYPSAGSVFKRPVDNFAGSLIEKSGLKGKTIGGAQVSEKHAGFIINRGTATCKDVLDLIEFIKNTVLKQTGIKLECEIKMIGGK